MNVMTIWLKIKCPVTIALLLAIWMLPLAQISAQENSKPNVLFIAVDDMNDWIGPLGGLSICKTPNLDKLAAQSMVFENAHCASPACSPSRLAIMTGVQPSKSGNMQNQWYDGPEWRKEPIYKDIETILLGMRTFPTTYAMGSAAEIF